VKVLVRGFFEVKIACGVIPHTQKKGKEGISALPKYVKIKTTILGSPNN